MGVVANWQQRVQAALAACQFRLSHQVVVPRDLVEEWLRQLVHHPNKSVHFESVIEFMNIF